MSVAKVHEIKRSQKTKDGSQRACEKCGTVIAVGDPYRWFIVGFRSKYKHVRCMKDACTPKPSERESSLLAGVYAAQEDFDLSGVTTVEDIRSALGDFTQQVEEVAQQMQDAAENPNTGTVFNTELQERGEMLADAAGEVEGWDPDDEPDKCSVHEDDDDKEFGDEGPEWACPDCKENWDTWFEGAKESAQQAVDEMELP